MAVIEDLRNIVTDGSRAKIAMFDLALEAAAIYEATLRKQHSLPPGHSPVVIIHVASEGNARYIRWYLEDYFPRVRYRLIVDASQCGNGYSWPT